MIVNETFEQEKEICKIIFDDRLTPDDQRWVKTHLELADVKIPKIDISWVTVTNMR